MFSKSLCTPQTSVRRMHGASGGENLAESVEHDKRSTLVDQPPKCGQGNESIRSDYDKPFHSMPNARKASITPLLADSVFNRQVSTVHTNTRSIAEQSHNTMPR